MADEEINETSEARSPYYNTVILDSYGLNKLIYLTKTYPVAGYGTGIRLIPVNQGCNLQVQNAHHYVSTTSMIMEKSKDSNYQFEGYEAEIASTFTDWETDKPAQICIIDTSYEKGNTARYTWLQGGSLLAITPKIDYNEDDEASNNGTFSVNENQGQSKYNIRIRGFDDNGHLSSDDASDPVIIGPNVSIEGLNGKISVSDTTDIKSPHAHNEDEGGNTTDTASINTQGGIWASKCIAGYKLYGAVFNDYAEFRQTDELEPGRCVIECGNGNMVLATTRLQPGANIISDTFGFSIGETKKAKTPIAVCGRVLAYPTEGETYAAGDAVCSAPNGCISKMTREEIREWPDRIIGYVSEIPTYNTWGSDNIKVNGRIWIKIH